MSKTVAIASVVAALTLGGPILAHDFWVQPSSYWAKPDELVQVRLCVGHFDEPEPVVRNPARIERFAVIAPDRESDVPGQDGKDPAGLLRPAAEGLHILVYDSNHGRSELEAAKFESYLREEGLERIIAERSKRGEASKPGVEIYSRCAKALVNVGGAAAAPDRAVGLKLELVAGTNPAALKPGDELPLTLLLDGEPVEGVKVTLKDAKHAHGVSEGRTGKDGRVSLKMPEKGVVLVTAVHMIRASEGSGADWESLWASLTYECTDTAKP
jgi:uncharacterized GH25 family protein